MAKPRKGKRRKDGAFKHPSGLTVVEADMDRITPIEWLWSKRLVRGALNLLVGEEDIGKSTVAAWLLAQVTQGKLAGDLKGQPSNVAVVGDEDDFDQVWVPRFHVVEGEISKLKFIKTGPSSQGGLNVRKDVRALRDFIEEENIALLYFDQLLDNLGATNSWKDQDVREGLAPLRRMVGETNCTALTTLHPNKKQGTFRDRIGGTPAFNALSRSSLFVGPHLYDPQRRAVVKAKGNYSDMPRSLEFEIKGQSFTVGEGRKQMLIKTNRIAKIRYGNLTGEDVCEAYDQSRHASQSKTARARKLLSRLFADGKARRPGPIQDKFLKDYDISRKTTANAAKSIGLRHIKKGMPAKTYWVLDLPDEEGK